MELSEVGTKFGAKTEKIVDNLTRSKKGETKQNINQRKYQSFLKIMEMDKDTRMVKVCDWLDNVRSWPYIPKYHPSHEKLERWFREAEKRYIPLAETVRRQLVNKLERALKKAEVKFRHMLF